MISETVQELSHWHTDAPTNGHYWKHTTLLRYR